MRTLRLKPIGSLTGYASPEEAIRAARERGVSDTRCRGQAIREVGWTDREAHFVFESGERLLVRAERSRPAWTYPAAESAFAVPREPSPVSLVLDGGLPLEWKRGALLERRIGATMERLFLNDDLLFLYLSSLPILLFTVHASAERPDDRILTWHDSD